MSARGGDISRTLAATATALQAGTRRPRTGNRVHKLSFYAGEKETRRWMAANRFSRSENNARMAAAEAFETQTRKMRPRAKNGALGHVALEVYRKLLKLRGRREGRLEPSIAWLATELGRSIAAVHRAIVRLKQHGFLDWVRRTRKIEDPEPGGPVVEQISNAYFLELRGSIADKVRQLVRGRTDAQRRAAEAADRDRRADRLAALPPAEQAADIAARTDDPEMAAALVALMKPEGDSSTANV